MHYVISRPSRLHKAAVTTTHGQVSLRWLHVLFALLAFFFWNGAAIASHISSEDTATVKRTVTETKTGAEALAKCREILGVECTANTVVEGKNRSYIRWPSFHGSVVIQTVPYTVYKTAIVFYCEFPNTLVEGDTHACADGSALTLSDPKNNGGGLGCGPKLGNPIDPATGNKVQTEVDYACAGLSGLNLRRIYNSSPGDPLSFQPHLFGPSWTTAYDAKVVLEPARIESQCALRSYDYKEICTHRYLQGPGASVTRGDNSTYRFSKINNDYLADKDVNDRLSAQYAQDNVTVLGWTYVTGGDTTEKFDGNGRLISITARAGAAQMLTYSDGATNDTSIGRYPADAPVCGQVHTGPVLPAGQLMCVTDSWGRQLNFVHDPVGLQVTSVVGPAGQVFSYEYDGATGGCVAGNDPVKCAVKNLTQVSYPGGSSKSYWYNESSLINGGAACEFNPPLGNGFGSLNRSLTGITDENSARFATWRYDCRGKATSSEHAGGVEKVTIVRTPTDTNFYTMVTHHVGTPAAPAQTSLYFSYTTLNNAPKQTTKSANCVECGGIEKSTYDAFGNVESTIAYGGKLTCFAHDTTRNLETVRLEGPPYGAVCSTILAAPALTAPTRKITTQWHATFRLRTKVAEPLRITTFAYDPNGNLLSSTVQATTDATGVAGFAATPVGAALTRTYTYNSFGQIKTDTGPRTDIVDRTTYEYDSRQNLSAVINALGHRTTLSQYDDNGRVGRVEDPNGMVVALTYHPRGWLESRAVTAAGVTETTTYRYDGVGQLKSATTPEGVKISYTYDDAHRLSDITDNMGNSIHYDLDFRGNRISEKTRDPQGTLTRQITRIFDTFSRPTRITGGAQ